ncbi:enoyl-CoA delta isomerase 1, mitochondrial-like [Bactrocera neohumeralis]|uniref:enoyl-CoA delta isomerase 1, mitochondrial-like n=1 Tax=Bactrocera neohumeralis TaxID=98809 RepID=UPI002166A4A2|nr:enoyl-CoA delta isomerase 1, mitochondrial-like [Bactrocera neohumeralis]
MANSEGSARAVPPPLPSAELKDLVVVSESPLARVCVMELNSPKANVLTADLMTRLLAAVKDVCDPDSEQRAHGIILTSKIPGIFSGGLDIKEMLRYSSQEQFLYNWNLFQSLFVTLHSLPVPLAVAINGHAAAGGTVVALGADYQ